MLTKDALRLVATEQTYLIRISKHHGLQMPHVARSFDILRELVAKVNAEQEQETPWHHKVVALEERIIKAGHSLQVEQAFANVLVVGTASIGERIAQALELVASGC